MIRSEFDEDFVAITVNTKGMAPADAWQLVKDIKNLIEEWRV